MSWIIRYERDNKETDWFFCTSKDPFRYFKKHFPKLKLLSIEDDWIGAVSQAVKEENGEAEKRLGEKCRYEQRTRSAIINEYGDPREWK